MKLSCNVAFPTMLQSVTWLSFSVFGESLKIGINFQFFFSAKTFKIVDRTTQGGGRGVHSHDNFLLLAPSPQIPFPPCEFFLPLPPSLPTHATLPWKGGSEKFIFTAQSLFKHERLRKNTLQGELIAKRKISRQERL